jgi:hypothetical protein
MQQAAARSAKRRWLRCMAPHGHSHVSAAAAAAGADGAVPSGAGVYAVAQTHNAANAKSRNANWPRSAIAPNVAPRRAVDCGHSGVGAAAAAAAAAGATGAAGAAVPAMAAGSTKKPRKVIIDTDPGVDDSMCICMALRSM